MDKSVMEKDVASSAIRAEGLSKRYLMYDKPSHRLLDMLTKTTKRGNEFWALKDVYLDIPHGSTVGIIGENGAGKSTLLKLLTGIARPTTGSVVTNGRVASLLELGAGFHPEFSGRENIFLNCSILGMSDDEIRDRYQSIVDFSELGDFIERPVKTYSSGMYVRLGFSVAASVNPDILLIDEALSVGDEHFKGKCINHLNEFREKGKTTVFVSHDMGSIKSMCQWVVLLDQGKVLKQGSSDKVADEYLKRAHERGNERMSAFNRGASEYPRWGSGEVETTEIELVGKDGKPTHVFQPGEKFKVRINFRVLKKCQKPVFGIGMYRSDGTYINGSNHSWRQAPIDIEVMEEGEHGCAEMSFDSLPLLKGEYYLTSFLYDHSKASPTPIDHREHAVTFQVIDSDHRQHGMLFLPTLWEVSHGTGDNTNKRTSQA
ncbi:MAG: ABC-type polysaccharide/polyol phosphate transport system ATPase subunit [Planctomycetota bacterium]|jgi:ABC-type polysaccharide/polyol phosphate transport system ATPase subunit